MDVTKLQAQTTAPTPVATEPLTPPMQPTSLADLTIPPTDSAAASVLVDDADLPAGAPTFLEGDMSGVDTSMPIIKAGIYVLEVSDIKMEPNKKGDGQNLRITLKTTVDDIAIVGDGDPVKKGFPIFHTISVSPTEKYSQEAITKAVATFVQAIPGHTRLFPLEQFKGQLVHAKVTVEQERTDEKTGTTYPAGNRVKSFLNPDKVK